MKITYTIYQLQQQPTNQQKNVLNRLRQQTGQVIILKRANILGLSIQLGITTYILS